MNNDEPSGKRDVAAARAERAVLGLKAFDVHLGAGRHGVAVPAVANQRVGRAAFDHPLLLLAGLRRDLDVQPRVRVAELHLGDDAVELDRSIDIELGRERMMRDHRRGDRSQQTATEYT